MIKMDVSTKQVFLTGFISFLLMFGGGLIKMTNDNAKHEARIEALQSKIDEQTDLVPLVHKLEAVSSFHAEKLEQHEHIMQTTALALRDVERNSTRVSEALEYVGKTNERIVNVVEELQKSVTRLETKDEINHD